MKKYNITTYYPKLNDTDALFLKLHKKIIWNFLNDGYQYAGLGTFKSCINVNALYKNTTCIRIGYFNNEIIAIGIYTSYQLGYKGVGYTITTNEKLRNLGKECLYDIIKLDIGVSSNLYYWSECSGAIAHIWEKCGGVKIPNICIDNYINTDNVISLNNDGFRFTIKNKFDEEEEKIIFGFNSKETFDKVSKIIYNYTITKHLNESINKLDELNNIRKQLSIFIECVYNDGIFDLPISSIKRLKSLINKGETLLIKFKNYNSHDYYKGLKHNIDICKIMLKEDIHELKINMKMCSSI